MQLYQLKSARKLSKRLVGRGGKRGGYSGKGQKGQKSRAGRKMRPELRDIIKRIPKKRGYRFASFQERPAVVNLMTIAKFYKEGEFVTPKSLVTKGIIGKIKGRIPGVKILGEGEIHKKINFSKCEISSPAREKIVKAGGEIKENK